MSDESDINPNKLRVVKTARTLDAINTAAREGFMPMVKPVVPGPDIQDVFEVYQHRETGEIELVTNFRLPMPRDYDCVIPFRVYYPYHFPEPFAAYLVPPDLDEGEHVWLEDIIEDIVAEYGNQGGQPRLEHCEAIYTRSGFEIQFDPEKDATRWLG